MVAELLALAEGGSPRLGGQRQRHHRGQRQRFTLTNRGSLMRTLSGASTGDLQRLELDLLAKALHPLLSPNVIAGFSSIRLDSTLAGVDAVMQAGLAGLAGWSRRQRGGRVGA